MPAILFLASTEKALTAFRAEALQAYGFHINLILSALTSEGMMLALPLLCALPYTTSFIDEVRSGFAKECLPRTTIRSYVVGKALACALSGGLTVALGAVLAYILSALVFLPIEAALPLGAEAPGYFAQLLWRVALLFASGAFWALVGLTFATLTNSKYMAYASPFVACYVLVILYERYFDTLFVLYPKEWINPSDRWVFGNSGVLLLVLEFTVIAALAFGAAAKRRLRQL